MRSSNGLEVVTCLSEHIASRVVVLHKTNTGTQHSSAASIAHDAFARARAQVLAEGPKEEHQKILADQNLSMEQFKLTLADAQEQYKLKHTSKAFKWLQELSSRVMHYGVVLDVLVQHHPEYVSLVWGAFRFMFSVSGVTRDHVLHDYCLR